MWRNIKRNIELYTMLAYLFCLFGYAFYGWHMFWIEAYSSTGELAE